MVSFQMEPEMGPWNWGWIWCPEMEEHLWWQHRWTWYYHLFEWGLFGSPGFLSRLDWAFDGDQASSLDWAWPAFSNILGFLLRISITPHKTVRWSILRTLVYQQTHNLLKCENCCPVPSSSFDHHGSSWTRYCFLGSPSWSVGFTRSSDALPITMCWVSTTTTFHAYLAHRRLCLPLLMADSLW